MAIITTQKVEELIKKGKLHIEIAKECKITREAIYHHIRKINGNQI